jgi:ELWxxDGT repeat protein
MYRSDGTSAGTQVFVPSIGPSGRWQEMGGKLYFGCEIAPAGQELCVTDGTVAGTSRVKEIFPGIQSGLTGVDHWLYYQADTSGGNAVWKSDGTAPGTARLVEVGSPRELQAFGNRLVFTGTTPNLAVGLWQSDGTPAGTTLVDPFLVNARHLGVANGRMWLTALDGGLGNELWTSDGTSAGTAAVKDIRAGFNRVQPR